MSRSLRMLVAMACLLHAPIAHAATGGVTLLPIPVALPPGKKPPKPPPMTILMDTTWVECNGYRPIRFTITPTPPLTIDRTVTLRMEPRGWTGGQPRIVMTQDFEIPANAKSATAVMAVPQFEAWNSFSLDVFDDGVPVPELSVPLHHLTINASNTTWGDSASPNMLLLSSKTTPHVAMMAFGLGLETVVPVGAPPNLIKFGNPPPTTTGAFAGVSGIAKNTDLPTRWIDYSGLDIIYAELPDLVTLTQQAPEQWEAIRLWIATGGNLWVAGVGQQWEEIPQLEKLMKLPAATTADMGDPRGWTVPDEKRRFESLGGLGRAYGAQANMPGGMQAATSAPPVTVEASQEAALFRLRSLGQGQIVAFGHDNPLAELKQSESWCWIFNSMGVERWSWYRRHGLSLQRDNPDFWEFLIPGVGLAPVTAFQVLITLFVLAIGPVNFMLLRRWRKLNLIVITVPLSALAVTGALVLYALLADGLGIRTRGRSYTAIDQRRGEAVCWARLSYYAGLRPSQGLAFPTDTAVYPIEDGSQLNYYGQNRVRRQLDWGQKQYLGAGWLNARTPTQLLTVSIRPAQHKLEIVEAKASAPTVKNLLGTRIQQLLLVDSQGGVFYGRDIAVDAKVPLEPSSAEKNAAQLTQRLKLNQLQRPDGMSDNTYGLLGVRRRMNYVYRQQYDTETAAQRTSVLERGLSGLPDLAKLKQPRTYVAIVDRSPEMSFGLESVKEEAGFHVIVGQW